jgi:hypothetical protein
LKINELKTNGVYGLYKGKEFRLKERNEDIYIISRDPEDLKNGIDYYINVIGNKIKDVFWKKVNKNELEETYNVEMYMKFKGYEFKITGVKNNKIIISTVGPELEPLAKKLNFKSVEPWVYDKEISLDDVEEIIERQEPRLFELKGKNSFRQLV